MQHGYNLIAARRRTWKNEAEVKHAWMRGLEEALGITLDAERARRDCSYNNVIIEFKAPGLFKGSKHSPKFIEAAEQRLLPYILREARRDGLHPSDYIGVATDGDHVAFAQVRDGKIQPLALMPFSFTSFEAVAHALRTSYWRAITPENLIEDFGHASVIGQALMQALADALADALAQPLCRKVQMLFEEWRTLYGQAADLSWQQKKRLQTDMGFQFRGSADVSLPAHLFVIHTFHSLLIKLIAAELVAAHGMAASPSFLHEALASTSDQALLDRLLQDIERSGFFEAAGLRGFVEEAIFSWYLDVPAHQGPLCAALRRLLAQLSVYRFDTVAPQARARDVLRDVYQDLVPEMLRKSLGEFYTPDWLVEHALEKAGVDEPDWLRLRVLDPTCGSGSFLLHVIARKRQAAASANYAPEQTAALLMRSVWGFDLNPLAVQSARANFLMAVADVLRACRGEAFEIPVLLADAVYSPAPNPQHGQDFVEYRIGSRQANLSILLPAKLVRDRAWLDQVFALMGESIEQESSFDEVEQALIRRQLLTPAQARDWRAALQATYDRILALHRQNWNGIWLRIIRNFFWSATAGHFDLVVGNPPWVRWSNLPEDYRERVKPTCLQYGIFSDHKYHGGNELDISAIITYSVADKWLIEGGRLVFVLTQTLFQSPSAQGFRRWNINARHRLVPLSVDDLKDLKPFPDAANKTAVALFTKTDTPLRYPIPYDVWKGRLKPGSHTRIKSIAPQANLPSVYAQVERSTMEAHPADPRMDGAPWAVMSPGRFAACQRLFGASTWVKGRKGISTDLNGVYFVEIIEANPDAGLVKVRTRPQEGKIPLGEAREVWVEADSLYPLAKGAADLQPCFFQPRQRLFTFVPNRGIDRAAMQEAADTFNSHAHARTYRFFSYYRAHLEDRSTYRTRMSGAPFFAIYNVGDYTFAPFKVLWAEMTDDFCAAVATTAEVPGLGERVYVPDHKLYFADFSEPEPAYFLCGLLHAPMVKEMIESHIVATNMGDIFKHIGLPAYDPGRSDHRKLVERTRQAHGQTDARAREPIVAEVREWAERIL